MSAACAVAAPPTAGSNAEVGVSSRWLTIRTACVLLAACLGGCGLKGDLVLPEEPVDEPAAEKSE